MTAHGQEEVEVEGGGLRAHVSTHAIQEKTRAHLKRHKHGPD